MVAFSFAILRIQIGKGIGKAKRFKKPSEEGCFLVPRCRLKTQKTNFLKEVLLKFQIVTLICPAGHDYFPKGEGANSRLRLKASLA
jgi:hypothetical protein